VPALLLVLGSFYAYRKNRHLLAGVLVSLAATVRYIFLMFAFGIGIAYILDNRENLLKLIAGGFIGSLPLLIYSKIYYGGFFARISMYLNRVSRWSDSGMFASVVPGIESGLYTLSALIPAVYPGWKETSMVEKSMIVVYSLFIILISGNSYNRYWLAILPFMLLIVYRGLDRRAFYVVSVTMMLISGVGVYNDAMSHQSCSQPLQEVLDYSSEMEGKFVSDNWAIAGYVLDQPVSSPWKSLDILREEYGVDYAIMSTEQPYTVIRSFSNNCRTYYLYDLSEPST
jgi:hypothetical protein